MLCSNCGNAHVCKYKSDTESFERCFDGGKIPKHLDNIVVKVDCKYYRSNITCRDAIFGETGTTALPSTISNGRSPYEVVYTTASDAEGYFDREQFK